MFQIWFQEGISVYKEMHTEIELHTYTNVTL